MSGQVGGPAAMAVTPKKLWVKCAATGASGVCARRLLASSYDDWADNSSGGHWLAAEELGSVV